MQTRAWLLAIAIPAVVSGIVVSWLLLANQTDMNVPVVYERDALYELTIFKGIGEGNLPWRNDHLAAPYGGSDWRDYPLYQWIDYAAYRFLSLFTHNYLALLNWYWVLTIMATAAIAAYAFLRLRAGPLIAGCLAFLYAMQPYVFTRNISHFNLLCYLVPLLSAACVEIAAGRWENSKYASVIRQIPLYAWLGFLLQGISFFYFSFFSVLLIFAAACFGACSRRTLRPFVHAACLIAVLTAGTAAGMSPTLLHWIRHGSNPAAVTRSAAEAEIHGLRIRHLLTPVPSHPLAFLRKLSDIAEASHQDRTEAATTRLGTLGSIGFVALMIYLFALLGGWRSKLDDGLVTACAVLILAAFLWCTVGGFGSIFNTYISPVIRAYDRIIVFLVFFILAAYGAVISALSAARRWHPLAAAGTLLIVTTLAFADELWIPYGIQTQQTRQTAASDRAFVATMEKALGGQGMVFQLPYTPYPDSGGPGKILPFDHARPYLQSSGQLKWSWGTVVGTQEARSSQDISRLPPDLLISQLRKEGFRGLWIDTYGYTDDPASMPAKSVTSLTGLQPLVSPDGRFLFFDLSSAPVTHAPTLLESSALPFPFSRIQPGGKCWVDLINGTPPTRPSFGVKRPGLLHIDGWVADVDAGVALSDVYVELTGPGSRQFYLRGARYPRSDVAQQFHQPSLLQSGFSAVGELDTLPPGPYSLRILEGGPAGVKACAAAVALDVR